MHRCFNAKRPSSSPVWFAQRLVCAALPLSHDGSAPFDAPLSSRLAPFEAPKAFETNSDCVRKRRLHSLPVASLRHSSGSVGRVMAGLNDSVGHGYAAYKDTAPQPTLPVKMVQSEGIKVETARIRHYEPSRACSGSGFLENESPAPPKTRPPGVTANL